MPTQLPEEHTVLLPLFKVRVTIQTHKQSLSNQVPIHSWVATVHMQVKCLVQGQSATLQQLRPVLKTSQSKVAGHSDRATTPCMHVYGVYILDVGTLRVVTARELVTSSLAVITLSIVILNGSLTFHSQVSETAPSFTWSCQPREIQCPMLRGDNLISTSFTREGTEPPDRGLGR